MKDMKLTLRPAFLILLTFLWSSTATSVLAQTKGEVTVRSFTLVSPVVALIAGILILLIPRLLNYIVAIYLIIIGLVGIFGR